MRRQRRWYLVASRMVGGDEYFTCEEHYGRSEPNLFAEDRLVAAGTPEAIEAAYRLLSGGCDA